VAHALEERPTEEDLEHAGIIKTKRGSMSDLLAATAVELEKNMTMDKVSHAIESRPSEHHLEETGIIKGNPRSSNLSNALVGTAVQLEVSLFCFLCSSSLTNRRPSATSPSTRWPTRSRTVRARRSSSSRA
jgi:hypothetical protein